MILLYEKVIPKTRSSRTFRNIQFYINYSFLYVSLYTHTFRIYMYRNSDTACRLGLVKTQRIISKLVKFYRWIEIGVEDLVITLSKKNTSQKHHLLK